MANSFSSFTFPNSGGRPLLNEGGNHPSKFTAKFHRCLGHVEGKVAEPYGVCTTSIGYAGSYTDDFRKGARTPKGRKRKIREHGTPGDPNYPHGKGQQPTRKTLKQRKAERRKGMSAMKIAAGGISREKEQKRLDKLTRMRQQARIIKRTREAALQESKIRDNLAKRFGIETFEPGNIGFSPSKNRWYGWSHRAVAGFTIGDTVKKGDVIAPDPEYHMDPEGVLPLGFTAKTMNDAKRMAFAFARAVS